MTTGPRTTLLLQQMVAYIWCRSSTCSTVNCCSTLQDACTSASSAEHPRALLKQAPRRWLQASSASSALLSSSEQGSSCATAVATLLLALLRVLRVLQLAWAQLQQGPALAPPLAWAQLLTCPAVPEACRRHRCQTGRTAPAAGRQATQAGQLQPCAVGACN